MIVARVIRKYKEYPTEEELNFCRERIKNAGKIYLEYGKISESTTYDETAEKPYKVEVLIHMNKIMFYGIHLLSLPSVIFSYTLDGGLMTVFEFYKHMFSNVKKMNKK